MDITGRFIADFSAFDAAVQNAQVELRGLETGSARVEKSLNAMVDQFSGRRLIQDANLMVEAIDRIGGAAKLTEKELAQVSAKAAEASEKMRALGLQVPAGLDKLAASTKSAGTEAAQTTSMFSGLAGQLAGMFTIGAGINFLKGVIDLADQIQKLKAQTGLTAEEVQKLQAVAAGSSVPITALVSGIQNLNLALGRGDQGVVNGIKNLGINLEAFKRQTPYEQLRELATAIGDIEDPTERATRAQEVFGRNWKEMLPALTEEFGKVGDAAWTMSDESSAAVDSFVDDLGQMYQNAKVIVGETIGLFMRAKNAVFDFAQVNLPGWLMDSTSIAASWGHFTNLLDKGAGDLKSTLDTVPPAISSMGEAAKATTLSEQDLFKINLDLNKQLEDSKARNKEAAEEEKKRAAATKKAADELAAWTAIYEEVNGYADDYKNIVAEIDEQLVGHIKTLLENGASIEKVATAYGLAVPQVKAIKAALDEEKDAVDKAKVAHQEIAALTQDLAGIRAEVSRTTVDQEIADINRWAADYKQKLIEAGTYTEEAGALIVEIQQSKINQIMGLENALTENTRTAVNQRADIERNRLNDMMAHWDEWGTAAILEQEQVALAAEDAARNFGIPWNNALETAQGHTDGALNAMSTSFTQFGVLVTGATEGAAVAMSRSFMENGVLVVGAAADTANGIVAAHASAAQQVVTTWSQAMEQVRAGQGTMSGQLPAAGPGSMTNYGPWGSEEHKAAIQKAFAAGRYFGPVVHRGSNPAYPGYESAGANIIGPDWEALGMSTPPGGTSWAMVGGKENAYQQKLRTWTGQFRADGGAVNAGEPYLVGEKGPELFLPNENGMVLPNSAIGPTRSAGTNVFNVTFNVNGTGQDVARVVSEELTRLMRQGRKWPAV